MLILVAFIGCAAKPSPSSIKPANPDFRNVCWGMTLDEVKQLEDAELLFHDEDTGLGMSYQADIAGYDATLWYLFVEGKLCRARYEFQQKHTNKNLYFDDFRFLKSLLEKKHGTPSVDEWLWLNDLFKGDSDRWGLALSSGHVECGAIWETKQEEISLILSGDNYEVSLEAEYVSNAHRYLIERMQESERLKNL